MIFFFFWGSSTNVKLEFTDQIALPSLLLLCYFVLLTPDANNNALIVSDSLCASYQSPRESEVDKMVFPLYPEGKIQGIFSFVN